MGNVIFNRRVKDDIGVSGDTGNTGSKKAEHRIFPEHVYTVNNFDTFPAREYNIMVGKLS